MNKLKFTKFTNELDDLISFLTTNRWEFHSNPNPSEEQIIKSYKNGWYHNDRETFWIEHERTKIGLIVIHDISDTIPLFDIRLHQDVRGMGFGTYAVNWLVDYIFNLPNKKIRIEAYTRSDNLAMRKTLHKCGFVKEGYLRNAWENDDGSVSDSIIIQDWKSKSITDIKLNDFPF